MEFNPAPFERNLLQDDEKVHTVYSGALGMPKVVLKERCTMKEAENLCLTRNNRLKTLSNKPIVEMPGYTWYMKEDNNTIKDCFNCYYEGCPRNSPDDYCYKCASTKQVNKYWKKRQ